MCISFGFSRTFSQCLHSTPLWGAATLFAWLAATSSGMPDKVLALFGKSAIVRMWVVWRGAGRGISRNGDRGSRIGDGRRSAATTRLIIKDIFLNGLGRTADNAHHITRSGRSDVFIFRGGVKRPTGPWLWLWPACQRSDLMCCPGSADSRRCLPKTRRTDSWQTNNLGLRGIKTAMAEINKKGAECSQHWTNGSGSHAGVARFNELLH